MTMVQLIFPALYGIILYYSPMFPFPLFVICLLHSPLHDLAKDFFGLVKPFYFLSTLSNIKAQYVKSLLIAPKFNNISTFYSIFIYTAYLNISYIDFYFYISFNGVYFICILGHKLFQSEDLVLCFFCVSPLCLSRSLVLFGTTYPEFCTELRIY